MIRDDIHVEYFNWLYDTVCGDSGASFVELLACLHDIEFVYSISRDGNRAEDGIDLRRRFAYENRYDYEMIDLYLDDDCPCSVLEMMVALAIRCEEWIMDDPMYGNRTSQWFWEMIINLGLGGMHDVNFNREHVENIVYRFLDREYEPDGRGGLFRIKHCDRDLREVEIWYQLCWYLDSIT